MRILLIEDNPGDVLLMKLALSEAGISFTQTVIDDGAAALQYVAMFSAGTADEIPQLILLDLNLPKLSGLHILREVRASAAMANVPVVILSSSESASDRKAALELGAAEFLLKPSDLSGVLRMGRTIRNVLERPSIRSTAE